MRSIALVLTFISVTAAAEDKPAAPPPPPPEVKKTVDAFTGKWTMDAEAAMPGATAPAKFKMTSDCKSIALGGGVACTMDGKVPDMGPTAQSCLMAYDPEGKAVHMMCVTSMGEVHDHKGAWKDDKNLEFEPYKFTMQGKAATETVSFTWVDAKTMSFASMVAFADGAKMTFAARGKRK